MTTALIIFYVIIALALIILVLLQDPKGGSGGIFGGGGGGGGGGGSLFGATGATSFIVKSTRWMAVLFAVLVVALNFNLMSGGSNSATESAPEIEAPKLIDDEASNDVDENATPDASAAAAVESVDSKVESAQNDKGEKQ